MYCIVIMQPVRQNGSEHRPEIQNSQIIFLNTIVQEFYWEEKGDIFLHAFRQLFGFRFQK